MERREVGGHILRPAKPTGFSLRRRVRSLVHREECLLEPRKLLAAIQLLQVDNARLAAENHALRDDSSRDDLRTQKLARRSPSPSGSTTDATTCLDCSD